MNRLLAVLALAGLGLLTGADWPRFRGPNGTGIAESAPSPSPTNLLWKIEVPGKGYGSPIVSQGKLFLQSASEDGKKRLLLCINAVDGKTVWMREVPGTQAHTHKKNTVSSGTPATDGELVYFVIWDGKGLTLCAYDFAGKPKWSNPLGEYQSEHGAGHSPAVYNGKVYVNFDQDKQAMVMAFDAKTGTKAWTAERKGHRASYTTPFLLEQPGKPAELVISTTTGVDSYNPATGAVNWHYTINWGSSKPLRMIGGPVYAGGLLISYAGEGGEGRYILALRPGGTGDVTATAKAWDRKSECPYVPCMIARDNLLYWVDDNGRGCCAEAKTGKMLWDETVFGAPVTSSPVLMGDELVAIAETGKVAVIKADREFDVLRKSDVGEKVYASPAVADGRFYVRGFAHLFCYGKKP